MLGEVLIESKCFGKCPGIHDGKTNTIGEAIILIAVLDKDLPCLLFYGFICLNHLNDATASNLLS